MITAEQLEPRLQPHAVKCQENLRKYLENDEFLLENGDPKKPFIEFFIKATPQLINEQITSHLMGVQAFSGPIGILTTTDGIHDNDIIGKAIEICTRKQHVQLNIEAFQDQSSINADEFFDNIISDIAKEYTGYIEDIVNHAHKIERTDINDNIQSAIDYIFEQTGLKPNTIVCSLKHNIPDNLDGIVVKQFDQDFDEIFVTHVSNSTAGAWYIPYNPLLCAGIVLNADTYEPEMTLVTRFTISGIPEEIKRFYCVI